MDEAAIRSVVQEVLRQLGTSPPAPTANGRGTLKRHFGVFDEAASAAAAAHDAYLQLAKLGLAGREKVVQIVKTMCFDQAAEWGRIELEETKIGILAHKVEKLLGQKNVPGTEWLSPLGMSGDHGITMEENCPFGVIGAITPVTHSIPTLACNAINMVAAGNAIVFNAHPGGAKCAAMAVRAFNEAIHAELGIENLLTIIETPSLESFDGICQSELVKLLCVTGGPGIVKAAMKSGKRAICAGPGNPPVLVDETADLAQAAQDIIFGGAWDNNLLCIGEKEVFVVDAVYGQFLSEFKRAGAFPLDARQLARLTEAAFQKDDKGHFRVNRDLVGQDATKLAALAGATVPADTPLLFAETDADHLFVIEEQMMPVLPVIRVRDVAEGIQRSLDAEHGYKHSAMIHSTNVKHMHAMARAMESTLFIKNGHCLSGLGSGGEGYASFSIATTTGEGITTPDTFTRKRRCVMVDALNLV